MALLAGGPCRRSVCPMGFALTRGVLWSIVLSAPLHGNAILRHGIWELNPQDCGQVAS